MWEAWTTAVRPPSRRSVAAYRAGRAPHFPLGHVPTTSPALSQAAGFSFFAWGRSPAGAAPKPIKQGLSARSATWSAEKIKGPHGEGKLSKKSIECGDVPKGVLAVAEGKATSIANEFSEMRRQKDAN